MKQLIFTLLLAFTMLKVNAQTSENESKKIYT